jgi:hypothetical protein
MGNKLEFAYDIYIGAPAAKVWKGIVDGEMTKPLRLRHPPGEQA